MPSHIYSPDHVVTRLRRALHQFYYDLHYAHELHCEYAITLWDAWKIMRWCRIYEEEEDCMAHPDEMAERLATERRRQRVAQN